MIQEWVSEAGSWKTGSAILDLFAPSFDATVAGQAG